MKSLGFWKKMDFFSYQQRNLNKIIDYFPAQPGRFNAEWQLCFSACANTMAELCEKEHTEHEHPGNVMCANSVQTLWALRKRTCMNCSQFTGFFTGNMKSDSYCFWLLNSYPEYCVFGHKTECCYFMSIKEINRYYSRTNAGFALQKNWYINLQKNHAMLQLEFLKVG